MPIHQDGAIFSASDLVNFMECRHSRNLDVANLVARTTFAPDDKSAAFFSSCVPEGGPSSR